MFACGALESWIDWDHGDDSWRQAGKGFRGEKSQGLDHALGDGDEKGGAVLELEHRLDFALAESFVADERGAAVVMQRARQDLTCACTAAIHQHRQWPLTHSIASIQNHPLHEI